MRILTSTGYALIGVAIALLIGEVIGNEFEGGPEMVVAPEQSGVREGQDMEMGAGLEEGGIEQEARQPALGQKQPEVQHGAENKHEVGRSSGEGSLIGGLIPGLGGLSGIAGLGNLFGSNKLGSISGPATLAAAAAATAAAASAATAATAATAAATSPSSDSGSSEEHHEAAPLSPQSIESGKAPSHEAKEHRKEYPLHVRILNFPAKVFKQWAKFLFQPLELVKSIAAFFKFPLAKLIQKLGRGLFFGVEILLQPLMVSIKIFEKLFQANECRLRFFCKMGSQLALFKRGMLNFSPKFLESSLHVKAFSDGVGGHDCEKAFANCAPTLKSEFRSLAGAKATTEPAAGESSGADSARAAL